MRNMAFFKNIKSRIDGKSGILPAGQKIAVVATAALTLVTLILRVVLTPQMQDAQTGHFRLSFVVMAVMIATLVGVAVLLFLSRSGGVRLRGRLLGPTALFAVLTGSILLIVNAVDAFNWLVHGETPPPNQYVISGIDALTLFFTIVFGLLGGAFFVRLGLLWLSESASRSGVMRLWALAPAGWVWMRLARYEVSYASAVEVSESFYDFVMLIFSLLFLFAFARYVSGIGAGKHRMMLFFALGTALFSLTGPLTSVFFYMTGKFDAYNLSHLAGATDWFIGAFALLFAFGLAFSADRPEDAPPPAHSDKTLDAPAATVDDILQEIYSRDE